MSYANKKIRVFREAGDREIQQQRSDGRMKTYTSATDARAWCDIREDRRQHILELIRQESTKGAGPQDSSDAGGVSARTFTSDSATPEKLTPRSLPVSDADEKAAQLLLAEDQLLALKDALANAEAFYQSQNAIAVDAIEMLESIKDIADGGDGIKRSPRAVSDFGNLPQKGFKEEAQALDDENDLRNRLDARHNLEEEVKALRDRAAAAVLQSAGDSKEKEDLLKRIAQLEEENSSCRCKMKELEKRAEVKAEWAMYKKDLESECNELRAKVRKCDELEKEKRKLVKKIEDCQCYMNKQDDAIKKLTCHIDCLTQDLDKQQKQMNGKEQKLTDVEDSLRSSLEQFSCERTCLRKRIEELQEEIIKYQKMLGAKEDAKNCQSLDNKFLQCKIDALENNNRCLEENNKALLQSLECEKATTVKLKETLKKEIKNDEHLKQMLKQAKGSIKCITQKLKKHDFTGSQLLKAERENYQKKIKELEERLTEKSCGADRIAELEEELKKAKANSKCLCEDLDEAKGAIAENDSLCKNYIKKIKELEEWVAEKSCGADRIAELEEELKKARANSKCLCEDLAENDILCENYMKRIKELEEKINEKPCVDDRIAELEEELKKANKCFCETLDQVKDVMTENENLRELSAELQAALISN